MALGYAAGRLRSERVPTTMRNARKTVCADSMSLNAIATPAAREPGPLVTRWSEA
jgi:hypothetical protein